MIPPALGQHFPSKFIAAHMLFSSQASEDPEADLVSSLLEEVFCSFEVDEASVERSLEVWLLVGRVDD